MEGMRRYIEQHVADDLREKMVFISGPRQCGKTTVAKAVMASDVNHPGEYFNWDSPRDRRRILEQDFSLDANAAVVLDELHKYRRWKGWLKGVYDTSAKRRFIVTGSARLDIYRKGGDSMLGRYHPWRLHPLSLSELPPGVSAEEGLDRLLQFGGFPEPFLKNDARFARRWRRERLELLLREDIRELEAVRDLATLELLVEALRTRVSGLVVAANIAQDLEVAPRTIQRWIDLLERMYITFSVRPLTRGLHRAVVKPPKVYFFDNADVVGDQGSIFENLVATHLLKRAHYLQDRDGHHYELRFLRDKDTNEVDFVVLKDRKVHELWEAKWDDHKVPHSLRRYAEQLKPKRAILVVGTATKARRDQGIFVCSAATALKTLEDEDPGA